VNIRGEYLLILLRLLLLTKKKKKKKTGGVTTHNLYTLWGLVRRAGLELVERSVKDK
jgi:hypothetical protein